MKAQVSSWSEAKLKFRRSRAEEAGARRSRDMDADMGDSFAYYWETQRYLESEELVDSIYYDSSSPDGSHSSSTPVGAAMAGAGAGMAGAVGANKNILMERDRRRNLNEKLYAIRSVVPNITKMDKASIIKDAIDYIQQLQAQERHMLAEVSALESAAAAEEYDDGILSSLASSAQRKKVKRALSVSSIKGALLAATSPPVEVLELRVSEVGDKVLVVSVTCSKRPDAMAKVCRLLEELRLRVITANITSVSGCLMHTLFVEVDHMDGIQMKEMVEAALSQVDATGSPPSSMSY